MVTVKLNWPDFKNYIDQKKLAIQYFVDDGYYKIHAFDANLHLYTEIEILNTSSADQIDFEQNYKGNANIPLNTNDSNGTTFVRNKLVPFGYTYHALSAVLKTADLQGAYIKTDDHSSYENYYQTILYDQAGLQTQDPSVAVKSEISINLPFTFYLKKCSLFLNQSPSNSCLVSLNLAGNSLTSIKPVDLLYISRTVEFDGVVPKKFVYDPNNPTLNEIKFVLSYPASFSFSFLVVLDLFKQ